MRLLPYFLIVLILSGLMSCDLSLYASNYDFTMNAVYIEPKTGAKAFVKTQGYVSKGEDIADPETATINTKILFNNSKADTLYIAAKGLKVQSVQFGNRPLPIKDSNLSQVLIDASKKILTQSIADSSLQEFADVIISTGAGPKGAFFKGQTKTIIVDTVYYITHVR
ncbi:MAG TPA: hypothetical protein VJ499_16255 [Flavisolibacter sp.]|nr:hypothetical protein [Flavisolibacter sp.]